MELTDAKRQGIVAQLAQYHRNEKLETEDTSRQFWAGAQHGMRIVFRALCGDHEAEDLAHLVLAIEDGRDCHHGNDPIDCPACETDRLEAFGLTHIGRACQDDDALGDDEPETDGTCPTCGYYADQHVGGACPETCTRCHGNGFLGDLLTDTNPADCPRCNRTGIEPATKVAA